MTKTRNKPMKMTKIRKKSATVTKTRSDEDVRNKPYLAGVLRDLGGAAAAEALFKGAGLSVADFYKQLSWEIDRGYIRDAEKLLEVA